MESLQLPGRRVGARRPEVPWGMEERQGGGVPVGEHGPGEPEMQHQGRDSLEVDSGTANLCGCSGGSIPQRLLIISWKAKVA
jgi:hypothetical protein